MNPQSDILINEAKRVLNEAIDSLEKAAIKIDDSFADAAKLAASAKKIIVSGVGKSGIIAKKIAATFSSIGLPALFLHPVEALHGDIGIVEKGDLVILLSKSGSTEEIVRLLPYIVSREVYIIAIVGNTNSYLARAADIVIDAGVERESCPLNLAPTNSTLTALALGDALAVCAMNIRNTNVEDFSRQHPLGQLGRNITLQVKDIMHKNSSLPLIHSDSSFRDAIIEITDKGLGCVCVIDAESLLSGIVTDGDIRRALQNNDDIRTLKTRNIMTRNPIVVEQTAYLGEALSLMENRNSQIAVLPVIDKNKHCVGVIRLHDVVRSGI